MKNIFTLIFLTFLVACGSSGSGNSVPSPVTPEDPSGETSDVVRGWRKTQPFYVSDRIQNDALVEGFQAALDKWNDLLGAPIFTYAGRASHQNVNGLYDSLADNKSIVIALSDWQAQTISNGTSKSQRTLATSTWQTDSEGYITQADILLNDESYNFVDILAESPLSPSQENTDISAEALLLHEVGHCTGMQHRSQDSSYVGTGGATTAPQIMNPYLPVGSNSIRTTFTDGDKDQLLGIYQNNSPALSLHNELYPELEEAHDHGEVKMEKIGSVRTYSIDN